LLLKYKITGVLISVVNDVGVGGLDGFSGFSRFFPLPLSPPLPLRDEARARTRNAVHDPLGSEE
jgi:hypothetical protein